MCAGINSSAKAKIGSWITLAEWKYSEEKQKYIPFSVVTKQVDGIEIKEDVYYTLQDGKFKESETTVIPDKKQESDEVVSIHRFDMLSRYVKMIS